MAFSESTTNESELIAIQHQVLAELVTALQALPGLSPAQIEERLQAFGRVKIIREAREMYEATQAQWAQSRTQNLIRTLQLLLVLDEDCEMCATRGNLPFPEWTPLIYIPPGKISGEAVMHELRHLRDDCVGLNEGQSAPLAPVMLHAIIGMLFFLTQLATYLPSVRDRLQPDVLMNNFYLPIYMLICVVAKYRQLQYEFSADERSADQAEPLTEKPNLWLNLRGVFSK